MSIIIDVISPSDLPHLQAVTHFENPIGKMFRVAYVYQDDHNPGWGITFGYRVVPIPIEETNEMEESELQNYIANNSHTIRAGQNVIVVEWKDFNDSDSGGFCRILSEEGLFWVHIYDLIKITKEEEIQP